jgi:FkbM family methyltransferase
MKKNVVVYSLGSHGEVSWESGIRMMFPAAEIHVFDPTGTRDGWYPNRAFATLGLHLHAWFVGASDGSMDAPVYSYEDVVTKLGHSVRGVDLLKIDIEGAEYKLLQDMRRCPTVSIINIELHGVNCTEHTLLFEKLDTCGYAIVAKEPNHWGCSGWACVEYTWVSKHLALQEWKLSHGCWGWEGGEDVQHSESFFNRL